MVVRRRLLAALAIGLFSTNILAARAEAGLLINQRSTGLPGRPEGAATSQRMLLGGGNLRIDDLSKGGRSYIVRLDKGVVWEVDPKLQMYTETSFEFLQKKRVEAEERRERARKHFLKKHSEGVVTDAEFAKWLRENASREDGRRVVTVARAKDSLGGESVERIAVELNGVTQVAVWQTDRYKDYKPPKELFEFYDRTGILPDDLVEPLKAAVTLFPARIYARVDYFESAGELETRVDGVVAWPEEPQKFEVPAHYKRVDEFPKPELEGREFRCPICGAAIDKTRLFGPERDKKTGEKVFFDSQEHWDEFLYKR